MSVVRSDRVAPQPWPNGGGSTRELLLADDGAWRVSLADISTAGAFSPFPGRSRLLTVVDGPVLALLVDGVETLVEPRRPFAFDGGAEVSATIPEGPVRALNLIVDPATVRPFVTVLELGRATATLPIAEDQAAFVLQGSARVMAQGAAPDQVDDAPAYSLVGGPVVVAGRCALAVITLERFNLPTSV